MRKLLTTFGALLLMRSPLVASGESSGDAMAVCSRVLKMVDDTQWLKEAYLDQGSRAVDVNNDGVPDNVRTSYEGTLRIQSSKYFGLDGTEIELSESKDINDGAFGDNMLVVELSGKAYILYCSGRECATPKHVEYIS